MLFGAAVFGIVGAAIGYYFDATGAIPVAALIGLVFGFLIGTLGGRRFFTSIVSGALLGGGLFGLISGKQAMPLGAATGGAMGGFLGIQMGMLLDLWRRRREAPTEASPQNDTKPE